MLKLQGIGQMNASTHSPLLKTQDKHLPQLQK